MDALRRIVHALHAANTRAEGRFSLTAGQLFVLREIARTPDLSYSDLAHRTRSAQSSVSEAVARLVEKRLVTRGVSPEDGRRARLRLTERGLTVAAQSQETVQERLIAGFAKLPEGTQTALRDALDSWVDASGLSGESPPMFFERTDPGVRA